MLVSQPVSLQPCFLGEADDVERFTGRGGLGSGQFFCGRAALGVGGGDESGQHRESFAGALIHAGLAALQGFCSSYLFGADRRWCRPRAPAGGFFHRPLGDVEIERANHGQGGQTRLTGQDALLPGRGDLGCQPQRIDSWGWCSRSAQNSLPSVPARHCKVT